MAYTHAESVENVNASAAPLGAGHCASGLCPHELKGAAGHVRSSSGLCQAIFGVQAFAAITCDSLRAPRANMTECV